MPQLYVLPVLFTRLTDQSIPPNKLWFPARHTFQENVSESPHKNRNIDRLSIDEPLDQYSRRTCHDDMRIDCRVYTSEGRALPLPIFQHSFKKEAVSFPYYLGYPFGFCVAPGDLAHDGMECQRQVPVIAHKEHRESVKSLVLRDEITIAVLHSFSESVYESTFPFLKDTFQDLFFALELPVKGASSNSSRLGNLLHRGSPEPVCQDQARAFPDYGILHVAYGGILHEYLYLIAGLTGRYGYACSSLVTYLSTKFQELRNPSVIQ